MPAAGPLARALEEDWRETLDAVARARGWPTSRDVAKLGARVAELSAAYNDPARARASAREAGAARLGFSFPRDVPKAAAAVRELVGARAIPEARPERPLRVLDIGAGLGASTWGLVRALRAAGFEGPVDATWVDADTDALAVGMAIVRGREGAPDGIGLRVHARPGGLGAAPSLGRFDVVLVGQVLSELDVALPEDARRQRHAEWIRALVNERCTEEGAVVVIEPALRDRARHLHRVRDALAEGGAPIFAPCLHQASCPALAREADWCHEDLPVDLPEWLAPVARAAGLRREGLTFSYLVLRRGGSTLAGVLRAPDGARGDATAPGARLRVVSGEIRTKGKREAFVCGELAAPGGTAAARARLMRLDRDAKEGNADWERARRGDVLLVTPAPDLDRPRIGSSTSVRIAILEADASRRAGPTESR